MIDFLNNYRSISIQPIFGNFKIQLNKITKDKIMKILIKMGKNLKI